MKGQSEIAGTKRGWHHLAGQLDFDSLAAMSKFSERAAAALERLPEELQERTVAFILEEADKLAALRDAVALGIADVEAGRVVEWKPNMFADLIDAAAKAKAE